MGFFNSQRKKKDSTLLQDSDDNEASPPNAEHEKDSASEEGLGSPVAPANDDDDMSGMGSPRDDPKLQYPGSPVEAPTGEASAIGEDADEEGGDGLAEKDDEKETQTQKKSTMSATSFLRRIGGGEKGEKEDKPEKAEKREKKEKKTKTKLKDAFGFGSSTKTVLPDEPTPPEDWLDGEKDEKGATVTTQNATPPEVAVQRDDDAHTPVHDDSDHSSMFGTHKEKAEKKAQVPSTGTPSAQQFSSASGGTTWSTKVPISTVGMCSFETMVSDTEHGVGIWKTSTGELQSVDLPDPSAGDSVTAVTCNLKSCFVGTSRGDVYEIVPSSQDCTLRALHRSTWTGVSVTALQPTPCSNLFVSYSNGVVHVLQPNKSTQGGMPHQVPLPSLADHNANGNTVTQAPAYECLAFNHKDSELYASCSAHYVIRIASGVKSPVSVVQLAQKKAAEIQRMCYSGAATNFLIAGDTTGHLYWRECIKVSDAAPAVPVKRVKSPLVSIDHLVCTERYAVAASTKDIVLVDPATGATLSAIARDCPDNFLTGVCVDPLGETVTTVELDEGTTRVRITELKGGAVCPAGEPSLSSSVGATSPYRVPAVQAPASPPPEAMVRSASASSRSSQPGLMGKPAVSPLARHHSVGSYPVDAKTHKSQASIDFDNYFKTGGGEGGAGCSKSVSSSASPAKASQQQPQVASPVAAIASPQVGGTVRLFPPVSPGPVSVPTTPGSTPAGTPTAAPRTKPTEPVGAQLLEAFHLLGGVPALETLANFQTHPQEKQRLKQLAAALKQGLPSA